MVSAPYDDHTARCVPLILTLPLYHRFPKYVPEKVPTFGSTPKVLEPQRLSAFFPKKSRFFPRHVIARRRGRRPLRPRAQASPQGETFPGGRLPPLRFTMTRKIGRRGKGPKWSSAPTTDGSAACGKKCGPRKACFVGRGKAKIRVKFPVCRKYNIVSCALTKRVAAIQQT